MAALVIGMSDGIISVFFSPTLAKILATLRGGARARLQAGRPVRGAGAMSAAARDRAVLAHVALIAVLFGLQFVLPDYHHLSLARVMVLAAFAVGYNILFGYTGLLSLGHAMFFAAGLYGAGLTAYHLGWAGAGGVSRGRQRRGWCCRSSSGWWRCARRGVAFMIVTMMFAQACYLLTLYFGAYTRGDEGFTVPEAARRFTTLGARVDLVRRRRPLQSRARCCSPRRLP